jgi:ubiquinone/menaquinone biosynthesis C-methylase UbiE
MLKGMSSRLGRQGADRTLLGETQDGRKIVLHVGCGPPGSEKVHSRFRGPDWREVRLDIDPEVHPDIVGSIVNMPNVRSETVDAVWSSHNLEHIYAHEVPLALREFFRVLRAGGTALITVPDMQQVAKAIVKSGLEDTLYVSPAGPIAPLDMIYGHRTSIQRGNEYMAHQTGFTAATLASKLDRAGFIDVDVKGHKDRAIWAIAQKPGGRSS